MAGPTEPRITGKTTLIGFQLDVTAAVKFSQPAKIAVTVHLSDPASLRRDDPIVCFAKPGGGYSRQYYTHDLPSPAKGA